jgi:hypothetical protein
LKLNSRDTSGLYAREKEQVDAFHRAGVEGGFRSTANPATGMTLWVLRGVLFDLERSNALVMT